MVIQATFSEHAVLGEDVGELRARRQLVARRVLAGDFVERPTQRFVFDGLRHDDDAVGIADDEVSRGDGDATAADRRVDLGDLAAAFRIERCDAAVKDREAQRPDSADIADQAVGHAADRTAGARRGRQQFAPRRDAARAATPEDRNFVGLEVVDQCDFELVGVFAGDDVNTSRYRPVRAKPASVRFSSSGRIEDGIA